MTTLTHCTSTIAWRITTCTEPARIVSQSLIITLTFHGSSRVLHLSLHLHVIHVCGGCLSLVRPSPLSTSSPSSCPSSFPSSSSPTTRLYTKDMENLRHSAANESEDTYDVFIPTTGYEPKAHDFDELQNSSILLSFKIPFTDQDVDDLTLGEMLTEAYRGQVDYFAQGGVSVSQSVVVWKVRWIRAT